MPASIPKGVAHVVQALLQGRSAVRGNSSTDGRQLFLHGNAIVLRVSAQPGPRSEYVFTLAGWNTPTTRRHLNAFFALAGVPISIRQCKGTPRINGTEVPVCNWCPASKNFPNPY